MELKTYTVNIFFPYGIDMVMLHDEINDSNSVNNFDGLLGGEDNLIILGDAITNEPILDGIVNSHILEAVKTKRVAEINHKSKELIKGGFQYAGETMSLSEQAQINAHVMKTGKDTMPYPIKLMDKFDKKTVTISNSNDLMDYFGAGLMRKMGILVNGTNLKVQIQEATTTAEIDAITDGRT